MGTTLARASLAIVCAFVWSVSCVAAAPTDAFTQAFEEPLPDLLKSMDHARPLAMLTLSLRLLQRDRYSEAFFWRAEAELRWRPHHPLDPYSDEDDAAFYLLNVLAGDFSNYRKSHHVDVAAWISTLNNVLAWDASHPDDLAAPDTATEAARAKLRNAIADMTAHQDALQRQNDDEVRDAQKNAVPDDPYSGSGGNEAGAPYEMLTTCDYQKIASFHVGVSKKDDVIQAFGKPTWWESDDKKNTTIWYGCLGPLSPPATVLPRLDLYFAFDPNKTLTDVHVPKWSR
jgi:hypothetical protein